MATFQNQIGRDVVSPPARLQFLNIEKPDEGGQYSDGKYKATFLFSKTETEFGPMKEVVEELAKSAFGCSARDLEYVPFRDGDTKTWQGFPGSIFIVSKSKYPVDVWSPTKDPATGELFRLDPKKLYPGCIARAHFAPLAYMSGTARGITFILGFIQFLEDAPRFGGLGQIDARDVLSEYIPTSKRPNGAVAQATSKPADVEAEEEAVSEEQEVVTSPAAPAKRGRPAKVTATETETPSARAKRLAGEQRAADDAKQSAKPASPNVVDLPVGQPRPNGANASSKSLMDMM